MAETFDAGMTRAIAGLLKRAIDVFVQDQTPKPVVRTVLLLMLQQLSTGRFRSQVERELRSARAEAWHTVGQALINKKKRKGPVA